MKKLSLALFCIFIFATCGDNRNPKAIPGLSPTDVYLNMEKQGFLTTKNLSSEGNTWENKQSSGGVDYSVQTFSSDVNSVEMVKANAMALPPTDASEAIQFFKYVSSLPYEGSDPVSAGNWVQANYDIDKATTIIRKAKFTIFVPSNHARLMMIEKF